MDSEFGKCIILKWDDFYKWQLCSLICWNIQVKCADAQAECRKVAARSNKYQASYREIKVRFSQNEWAIRIWNQNLTNWNQSQKHRY